MAQEDMIKELRFWRNCFLVVWVLTLLVCVVELPIFQNNMREKLVKESKAIHINCNNNLRLLLSQIEKLDNKLINHVHERALRNKAIINE